MVGPLQPAANDPAGTEDHSNDRHEPGYPPEGDDSGGPGELARVERIAELAARLASIESRDRGAAGQRSRPVPAGSPDLVAPSGAPPEFDPVPIGSSGSVARRRIQAGGHPEDAPGDPEAVAKAICL